MNATQMHTIIVPIIVLIFSGLVSIVIGDASNKIKKIEKDTKEIRDNYLERFEKVQRQANENKEEILLKIADIKVMLEKEFVRK